MVEIVSFSECEYDKYANESKNTIYADIHNKAVKNEMIRYGHNRFYHWYSIHCDVDNKWYTTNSWPGFNNNYLVTNDMPAFFGSALFLIDNEHHETLIIMDTIPEVINENTNMLYINGLVIFGDKFCYYQDNENKQYYISYYHSIDFFLVREEMTNECLQIDYICKEYSGLYYDFIVISSCGKYYMFRNYSPYDFHLIDSIPNTYDEMLDVFNSVFSCCE